MVPKFIVFSLLVASTCSSDGYSSFSHGVTDPNGDVKDQHEKRVADSVVEKYSLLESDGTKKIVKYEVSADTGFNALVQKELADAIPSSEPVIQDSAANPANESVEPVNKAMSNLILPQIQSSQMDNSNTLINSSTTNLPATLPKPDSPSTNLSPFYLPGSMTHPSVSAQHDAFSNSGVPIQRLSSSTPNCATHSVSPPPGYLAVTSSLTQEKPSTQSDAKLTRFGFAGPVVHSSNIAQPTAMNNLLPNNYGNSGTNPFGPQGVPRVSYYSHSIIHEIPRVYPGSNVAGFNNLPNKETYGVYNGIQRFGAQGEQNEIGGFLEHGLTNSYGHDIILPRGLAYSYSSLTRGESYPHGYGGNGARSGSSYDDNFGNGVDASLV